MPAVKLLGDSAPHLLPMLAIAREPAAPVRTFVNHIPVGDGCATSVTRIWAEARFKTCDNLCDADQCSFDSGVCVVGVDVMVPAQLCPMLAKRSGA